MLHPLIVGLFALAWLAPPLRAEALRAPDEVAIYVHSGVGHTEFAEPLVCSLAKVLAVPVRATTLALPLTPDLLDSDTQFSPRKIAPAFVRATAGHSALARPFRFFILDEDLRSKPLSWVFAETFGNPSNLSVISLARLEPNGARLTRPQVVETTERRVYKLVLKSVAMIAGLKSDGCVMKVPRNVDELDRKSAEFCPDDQAALVAARVIRETPSNGCSTVVPAP